MRITTRQEAGKDPLRLDSYCKYTKNYANHNREVDILEVLKVGFLLQIY